MINEILDFESHVETWKLETECQYNNFINNVFLFPEWYKHELKTTFRSLNMFKLVNFY